MLGKLAFFFGVFTSQSEAGGRTEGRRLSTKTSPKGEFECLKAASTKCEWLGVRITFRIWFFLSFQGHNVYFLIFRAEAYTCWSARFARSRVGGVARLFKEISVFFGFWYFFSFFEYFLGHSSHLWLFYHERAAFYYEKKTVFDHFIRFQALALIKR